MAMPCQALIYSRHAFERMFQRGIPPEAVEHLIHQGEVIAEYPDDRPYPSALILGFFADTPVHAVVARDEATGDCQVITVYCPDPMLWDATFKKRKQA